MATTRELYAPLLAVPRPATTGDVTFRILLLAVLYSIPVVAAVRPVVDLDVWWHLRVGQWIVEHRTVPQTDLFSQAGLGHPWAAYSWLFEVPLYFAYRALGLTGILLLRVFLSLAVTVALHRLVARRERRFLPACLLTGVAVAALLQTFNERPWLVSILFTTLTLDTVLSLREGRAGRGVWLLPVAFVLWANLHIQFVFGLCILGLACVAPIIDLSFQGRRASANWGLIMVLSAACALATLLNPYHAQLYSVVLQYATQPGPYRLIVELMALDFREPGDWAVLGLTVAAAFTLGRGGRPSAFDVLLMLGTAYVSYRARRDAWLVVVAALGVVAAGMARKVREVEFRLTPARAGWVTAAVGMVLFFAIRARGLDEGGLAARAQAQLPVQAAAHVAEHGYPGPLYNHFNWGGYLIWALPDRPVAIDGRTNVQGDERIFRYERTWNGFPGWETDPDLQKAGVVVADRDRPLTALLRGDRRFTSVYEDDTAVVFVRRTAAAAP